MMLYVMFCGKIGENAAENALDGCFEGLKIAFGVGKFDEIENICIVCSRIYVKVAVKKTFVT